MIVFLNSWALLLFLIFPIFFLLKYFGLLAHFKIYFNLVKWGESGCKHKNFAHFFFSFMYKSCLFLSISALILVVAEPCVYKARKTYSGKGETIMFLLDVSPSMAVRDVDDSTRFFVAKKIVEKLVTRHNGASFALSTFAAHASLLVLPTIDVSTFLFRLNLVELGELGEGTAIGESIALALANIRDKGAHIVLLTDGENNTGRIEPSLIAKMIKQRGIKLYIVQLGKEGYAPLEYFDEAKQKQYSGTYFTKTNSSAFASLAEKANGKHITIQKQQDIQACFGELEGISHNEAMFRQTQRQDLSFYFVAVSLVLSIASWVIARMIMGLTND